jgi:hypothetical protein
MTMYRFLGIGTVEADVSAVTGAFAKATRFTATPVGASLIPARMSAATFGRWATVVADTGRAVPATDAGDAAVNRAAVPDLGVDSTRSKNAVALATTTT